MADRLGQGLQLASNALKFSWFTGVNWLVGRESRRIADPPRYQPERPVPTRNELFADLAQLFARDALLVRDDLLPADRFTGRGVGDHLMRLRGMFDDLPGSVGRRVEKNASTAAAMADTSGLPDYFTQDFHFQTGGYLSEDSARIYDVQVETLFYGAAGAMRREGLRPIAEFLRGKDQRDLHLLDVACGTGRLLRDIRRAFPALGLTGIDLSEPYLAEAESHMSGLRPALFRRANAEAMPFSDASQDIVTCVYLFHELPPDVRRRVASEIARVLKPGGLFVFIDSLQMGDRPNWDGLLEAFPVRFHEPYFRHYTIDGLDEMFTASGLIPQQTTLAFLSKVMAFLRDAPRKSGTGAFEDANM